ncbi:hypothetical protein [Streptomyces sp. NPDC059906]|uniref:hypothetical protein n=1 Tax=Streptomyces sp. NPDC059906 TaxID=3346997 RepID=UPI00365118BF
MSAQDRIRLMLWTPQHDGGPEDQPGVLPTRWRQDYEEVLKPQQADWLAMLELKYSQTRPDAPLAEKGAAQRRFTAAQQTLGMRGFRSSVGQRANPTALFIRESVFASSRQRHHPVGHRKHAACWLFGDTNSYPVPVGEQVPPIDWSTVTDIVHRRHRAIKQPDGTWVSCTEVDEIMLDCGMHDPACWAAHRLGQATALAATIGNSGHQKLRNGCGGGPVLLDHHRSGRLEFLTKALDVAVGD